MTERASGPIDEAARDRSKQALPNSTPFQPWMHAALPPKFGKRLECPWAARPSGQLEVPCDVEVIAIFMGGGLGDRADDGNGDFVV